MKKIVVTLLILILCFNVFAGSRPSVTAKTAPTLSTFIFDDGSTKDDVVGELVTEDKQEDLYKNKDIFTYAIIDSNKLSLSKQKELKEAYNLMSAYKDLTQLVKGLGIYFENMYPNCQSESLVATDVFYLDLIDEYNDELNSDENSYVGVSLKPMAPFKMEEQIFVAYYSQEEDGWVSVNPKNVKFTATGIIQVDLPIVGPVVFIKMDFISVESNSGVIVTDSIASTPITYWERVISFFDGVFGK